MYNFTYESMIKRKW